jgi:hypothetical protein
MSGSMLIVAWSTLDQPAVAADTAQDTNVEDVLHKALPPRDVVQGAPSSLSCHSGHYPNPSPKIQWY